MENTAVIMENTIEMQEKVGQRKDLIRSPVCSNKVASIDERDCVLSYIDFKGPLF